MPAEPQQMSGSAISRSSSPGMPRSSCAGLRADALGVRQMAGVVVGDGDAERVPGRATGPSSARNSATSRTLRRTPRPARAHSGSSAQQVGVVLHRRPAAGGVDDDGVDAGRSNASIVRAGERASPPPPGRCAATSAPQQPCAAGMTTSQPSAASTRAVAALTPGKNSRCTQPVSIPTTARRGRRAPRTRSGRRLGPAAACGARPSIADRVGDRRLQQAGCAGRRVEPDLLVERAAGRAAAEPPRVRERARRSPRAAAGRCAAARASLDLGAGDLDEPVVLDARRAGGHAGHAAEAARRSARPSSRLSGSPSRPCFIRWIRPRGESISSPHST